MTTYTMNCPPVDCGPCGTLPSGFVRLRYFYGKRLNVADFVDEQRYHSGKLRFHQQRMHGSGVLCGLACDLFSNDPADATILRVHRGAAVDDCGRDIIVGGDQCLDVDAWLGKKLAADPSFLTDNVSSKDPTHLPLCVVIRYRECPGAPEAAPRDACGCDSTGCDYGRVREEFELDLIPQPMPMIVPAIFPPRAKLLPALAAVPSAAAAISQIATLATAECAGSDGDGWLEIACFTATLQAPASATDRWHVIGLTRITPAETVLYETALLQELLMREVSAQLEAGTFSDGPEIASIGLDSATAPTAFVIALSMPVLAPTLPANLDAVFGLRPWTSAGWGNTVTLTATLDANGSTITLKPADASVLAANAQFRISSLVPDDMPITDASMRPLRPLHFSMHAAIAKDASSNFSLAAPPIV